MGTSAARHPARYARLSSHRLMKTSCLRSSSVLCKPHRSCRPEYLFKEPVLLAHIPSELLDCRDILLLNIVDLAVTSTNLSYISFASMHSEISPLASGLYLDPDGPYPGIDRIAAEEGR